MCLSLHPHSRFYPERLGTAQWRGPALQPGYFIESSSSYSDRSSSGTPAGNPFVIGARSKSDLSGYRVNRD